MLDLNKSNRSSKSIKCKDEIHKYKRYSANSSKRRHHDIYHCIRCPHYTPLEFIIGRTCECWICAKPFIMTEKTLQLKPNCGCKVRTNKTARDLMKINETKDELIDLLISKVS